MRNKCITFLDSTVWETKKAPLFQTYSKTEVCIIFPKNKMNISWKKEGTEKCKRQICRTFEVLSLLLLFKVYVWKGIKRFLSWSFRPFSEKLICCGGEIAKKRHRRREAEGECNKCKHSSLQQLHSSEPVKGQTDRLKSKSNSLILYTFFEPVYFSPKISPK